MFIINHVP